jgi:hypothetical protein
MLLHSELTPHQSDQTDNACSWRAKEDGSGTGDCRLACLFLLVTSAFAEPVIVVGQIVVDPKNPSGSEEGDIDGPVRKIGGGVSAPRLLYSVEPQYSEEARSAKLSGKVLVNILVGTNSIPTHVHAINFTREDISGHQIVNPRKPIRDLGLDEKAVEAVKQYKFKPPMENGKPVLVELNVEVKFEIFWNYFSISSRTDFDGGNSLGFRTEASFLLGPFL